MKKTFCDHCGKEISPCAISYKIYNNDLSITDASDCTHKVSLIAQEYDLCANCKQALSYTIMQFFGHDYDNKVMK